MGCGDCVFLGRTWWERIGQRDSVTERRGKGVSNVTGEEGLIKKKERLGKKRKGKGIIVTKQVFSFLFSIISF